MVDNVGVLWGGGGKHQANMGLIWIQIPSRGRVVDKMEAGSTWLSLKRTCRGLIRINPVPS